MAAASEPRQAAAQMLPPHASAKELAMSRESPAQDASSRFRVLMRASRSVGVIKSICRKRLMSPTCDDDWLSAAIMTPLAWAHGNRFFDYALR